MKVRYEMRGTQELYFAAIAKKCKKMKRKKHFPKESISF